MNKSLLYIAECFVPSSSAYSIHVLKMCDNASHNKYNVDLIVPQSIKNFLKIRKDYNLKNNFKIISCFYNLPKLNFLYRIFFSIWAACHAKKKKYNLVITRSFYSSFFLTLFKCNHFLEIHGKLRGLTNFIFLKLNFINSKYIIRNIFITNKIAIFFNLEKKKYIVLPDGFDQRDFNYKFTKTKKIETITYTGSFYKGKGVELVIKLSRKFPKKKFFLYGNKSSSLYGRLPSNVKIFDYITYKNIPRVLRSSDLLLLPYSKKVYYNDRMKDDIGRFHSPLKMFEYLATGRLIMASNNEALREVLKDNVNCLIVKNNRINSWKKKIIFAENNIKKINSIAKFALFSSKKYSWSKRFNKIANISH